MPHLVVRRNEQPEPERAPATLAGFRRAWAKWMKTRVVQEGAAHAFIAEWATSPAPNTMRARNDDYYAAFMTAHFARQKAIGVALRLDADDRAHVEAVVGPLFAPDGALGPCWDEWRAAPWVGEVNALRRAWRDGYLPTFGKVAEAGAAAPHTSPDAPGAMEGAAHGPE